MPELSSLGFQNHLFGMILPRSLMLLAEAACVDTLVLDVAEESDQAAVNEGRRCARWCRANRPREIRKTQLQHTGRFLCTLVRNHGIRRGVDSHLLCHHILRVPVVFRARPVNAIGMDVHHAFIDGTAFEVPPLVRQYWRREWQRCHPEYQGWGLERRRQNSGRRRQHRCARTDHKLEQG